MPKTLRLRCLLVVALGTAGLAAPGEVMSAEGSRDTNWVSIETPVGGEPMLVVRYPWTLHEKPSIEVRTYLPGEEDSVRIRPLYFRHVFMKSTVTIAIYETQAAASTTQTIAEFVERGIEFKAVGQRSLLGRPAVCVTCETKSLESKRSEKIRDLEAKIPGLGKKAEDSEKKTDPSRRIRWAIFPFAEAWAADDNTLFLSLPEVTFSRPAKIRVFFLRDNDVVWSETKQWPGLNSDAASQAPESQPTAPGPPAG